MQREIIQAKLSECSRQMKRIAGIKKGQKAVQVPSNHLEINKVKKTKREMSPRSQVPQKKEPKLAPWRFTGSTASQPVGLGESRSSSRNPRLRANPISLNSAMIRNREDPHKSQKSVSKQKLMTEGRPLWGLKMDNHQPQSRSQSRNQIPRYGNSQSNLKLNHRTGSEQTNRPKSTYKFGKEVNGGKGENQHKGQIIGTMDVESQQRGVNKGDLQSRATLGNQNDNLNRERSTQNLKSSLKRFPRTNRIEAFGERIEENQLVDEPNVEQADNEASKTILSSQESPARRPNVFDFEAAVQGDDLRSPEAVVREPLDDGYQSRSALITNPEDVEALRRLTNYNRDNPTSNYYIEFNQQELKGRTSERYGGLKRIVTPQLRSKRLSKRRASEAGDVEDDQKENRERRPRSSSRCSVHRREKLHGLPAQRRRWTGHH
jgi:hypothetical protein